MERSHILEITAEFIVIFGVGAAISYWIRGTLDIISVAAAALIGLAVLLLDEMRKEKNSN